jgi:arsenate reductase-like glutaredoxin family protein
LDGVLNIQIFGVRNSPAVRSAERFFADRRIPVHFVDLKKKPMAPGEIRRFVERFSLTGLLNTEGKSFVDAGLGYMRLSDSGLLARIEKDPSLLRLPLIRAGNRLSVGQDEAAWKAMLDSA